MIARRVFSPRDFCYVAKPMMALARVDCFRAFFASFPSVLNEAVASQALTMD
jgi:hypothetical protein